MIFWFAKWYGKVRKVTSTHTFRSLLHHFISWKRELMPHLINSMGKHLRWQSKKKNSYKKLRFTSLNLARMAVNGVYITRISNEPIGQCWMFLYSNKALCMQVERFTKGSAHLYSTAYDSTKSDKSTRRQTRAYLHRFSCLFQSIPPCLVGSLYSKYTTDATTVWPGFQGIDHTA